MSDAFRSDKLFACQIPAIELLVNLGYQYLSPEQLHRARGARVDHVLLEDVLRQRLSTINQIVHRDQFYPFSDANIGSALERIKGMHFAGLLPTNAALYDLLIQGISLPQTVEGDSKNYPLHYIDWLQPDNNVFHVTAHYPLECRHGHEVRHVDLVLFVNGIPFVVIGVVAPQCPLAQAEQRLNRLQEEGQLPHLFAFAHVMLAINGEQASYSTVGVARFAQWREPAGAWQDMLSGLGQRPLPDPVRLVLYDWAREQLGPKTVTRQERSRYRVAGPCSVQEQTLYALCRPARLLHLVYLATLFDDGVRKLARHHQFFAVERALAHVRGWHSAQQRQGGLIVHSAGSGKSLAMILLARRLLQERDWPDTRVVLISSRPDFGLHWRAAFAASHTEPVRAKSGRDLLGLIAAREAPLLIALPFRLSRASGMVLYRDLSPNIFVLFEEDHQPDMAQFVQALRKVLPNACHVFFSATPMPGHALPLIDYYSHQQAQQDGLTVPIVYQARPLPQGSTTPPAMATPPTRIAPLARHDDQQIVNIAFDVSTHYHNIYARSGLKGQLVAPDHHSACRYKEVLDELGYLDSALVISGKALAEDTQPPSYAPDPAANQLLQDFWHRMIAPYGQEEAYQQQILSQFATNDKPELMIVVDQWLAQDAEPRTAVLYLARRLSGHTLLQALARVNRSSSGNGAAKSFGQVVDYTESLGLLDQPLSDYPALAGFEAATLDGFVIGAERAIATLPVLQADCWQLFQICRPDDEQARLERELEPRLLRTEFIARLARFAKTLNLALCDAAFLAQCPGQTLAHYQRDALRLLRLKMAAQLRYGDMPELNPDEMLLWHRLPSPSQPEGESGSKVAGSRVPSSGLTNNTGRTLPSFSLHDPTLFQQALDYHGLYGDAARADALLHHMRGHLAERDEDRLLPLARQLQIVHEQAQSRRIDDAHYLQQVQELYARLLLPVSQGSVAEVLQADALALALYDLIYPHLNPAADEGQRAQWCHTATRTLVAYLPRHSSRPYLDDSDRIKQMANRIDDYLCDVMAAQQQIDMSQAETLIEQILQAVRQHLGQMA